MHGYILVVSFVDCGLFLTILLMPAPSVVVIGFSRLVFTAHEEDFSVAISLGKRGVSNLPVTVGYYTEDDTTVGWSLA